MTDRGFAGLVVVMIGCLIATIAVWQLLVRDTYRATLHPRQAVALLVLGLLIAANGLAIVSEWPNG